MKQIQIPEYYFTKYNNCVVFGKTFVVGEHKEFMRRLIESEITFAVTENHSIKKVKRKIVEQSLITFHVESIYFAN